MAQIDTGSHDSQRRQTNRELPLVPFIDFLLCLVSFLLITAVWSQKARLDASANVPGPTDCKDARCKDQKAKRLHVEVKERKFLLVWKQGNTVISEKDVVRRAEKLPDGNVRYPALEAELAAEWKTLGDHRSASDPGADQAVLHTDNATESGELIAVVDALHAPKRALKVGGATQRMPAFAVTFAAN